MDVENPLSPVFAWAEVVGLVSPNLEVITAARILEDVQGGLFDVLLDCQILIRSGIDLG